MLNEKDKLNNSAKPESQEAVKLSCWLGAFLIYGETNNGRKNNYYNRRRYISILYRKYRILVSGLFNII